MVFGSVANSQKSHGDLASVTQLRFSSQSQAFKALPTVPVSTQPLGLLCDEALV